ncbi:hypothetical protein BCR44DRAFT_47291 [Catenaria anguillulae PL171]|uniref:Uncharacterized protein n=1 Tax=Catenaria anguillulae PL171 TaxID=765915 RepID=A0A1Y2HN67_9FUNG|nr:hypothetical protein BCR44DRAFT_47291 [Catenaria anguillulae PL171]
MLEHWLDELLESDFEVEHLPGVLNVLPNCLSRLYSVGDSDPQLARRTLCGRAVGHVSSTPSSGSVEGGAVPVHRPQGLDLDSDFTPADPNFAVAAIATTAPSAPPVLCLIGSLPPPPLSCRDLAARAELMAKVVWPAVSERASGFSAQVPSKFGRARTREVSWMCC